MVHALRIGVRRREMGVEAEMSKTINWVPLNDKIFEMFYEGCPYAEISEAVGIGEKTIQGYIRRVRYKYNIDFDRRKKAERKHREKFDWDKLMPMVEELFSQGYSTRGVAERVGVPYSTIYGHMNGEQRRKYIREYMAKNYEKGRCRYVKRVPKPTDCINCTRDTCVLDERQPE